MPHLTKGKSVVSKVTETDDAHGPMQTSSHAQTVEERSMYFEKKCHAEKKTHMQDALCVCFEKGPIVLAHLSVETSMSRLLGNSL